MMQAMVMRIFEGKTMPPDASKEEYSQFIDTSVKEFENGGFLEANKLPPISSEAELHDVLYKHRDELVVLKYWKRGCLPCLVASEAYKGAEKMCADEKMKVKFFSVDSKLESSKSLTRYQLIDGTPCAQAFHGGKQVGDEFNIQQLAPLVKEITARAQLAGLA